MPSTHTHHHHQTTLSSHLNLPLPPVTNTIALSEDRCASREHGTFAVHRRGAHTALVYTDRSHYGSIVDGTPLHGASATLLTSTDVDRTCTLVLGKTSLTARVAPARVYLLADDSSRTGAAPRGAEAAAQLGVAVDDITHATHFALRGDTTSSLVGLTPELLYALAAARPVVSAAWLARAAADDNSARLLTEGLSPDTTLFLPRVAAAEVPGLVPYQLVPDPARTHVLDGRRFVLAAGVPPLYGDVLRAAGAAAVSCASADSAVAAEADAEDTTTTLVLQRTGAHQMTVDELARSVVAGAVVPEGPLPGAEAVSECHSEPQRAHSPVQPAQTRSEPQGDTGGGGDAEGGALTVTDIAHTPRKRFRKSLVHTPTAYVDVGDHST